MEHENRKTTLGSGDSRKGIVFSLDSVIPKNDDDVEDSFFEVTEKDARIIFRDLTRAGSAKTEAPFRTAKLREAEEQEKLAKMMKLCKNTIIRVRFPNRLVVQGVFQPTETISDVCDFVRNYLAKPDRKFHLFTTPPKRVVPVEKTLVDANCCPRGVLHFGNEEPDSEDGEEFLKEECLAKLSSAEEADVKASASRTESSITETGDSKDEGASTSKGAIPKRPRQSDVGHTLSSGPSTSAGRPGTSGQVPKWFKPIKK